MSYRKAMATESIRKLPLKRVYLEVQRTKKKGKITKKSVLGKEDGEIQEKKTS